LRFISAYIVYPLNSFIRVIRCTFGLVPVKGDYKPRQNHFHLIKVYFRLYCLSELTLIWLVLSTANYADKRIDFDYADKRILKRVQRIAWISELLGLGIQALAWQDSKL